jgi:hypothetical protein
VTSAASMKAAASVKAATTMETTTEARLSAVGIASGHTTMIEATESAGMGLRGREAVLRFCKPVLRRGKSMLRRRESMGTVISKAAGTVETSG